MADGGRPDHKTVIGSVMVLVGLGFFVTIFVALFPVLTNPTGAYDHWFPETIDTATENESPQPQPGDDTTSTVSPTLAPPVGPTARFAWEAIGTEVAGPTATRVRVVSASTPGDAEIVAHMWELGDGSTAVGETVTHDYAALGSYTVVLRVRDADGRSDVIRGTVTATGDITGFGAANRVANEVAPIENPLDGLGDGITTSLEDAVDGVGEDINATIDSALGSIGSTVRGAVVVALFALSAFAATIVAWRTARIGVMLLLEDPNAGRRPTRRRSRDEAERPRHLEVA